jgi:hypothetical protein
MEQLPQSEDQSFYRIGDDIADNWMEDWVGAGIGEIEDYLAKHAKFFAYLALTEDHPESEL